MLTIPYNQRQINFKEPSLIFSAYYDVIVMFEPAGQAQAIAQQYEKSEADLVSALRFDFYGTPYFKEGYRYIKLTK